MRPLALAAVVVLHSCASVVPAGAGSVGTAASARLAQQQQAGSRQTLRLALGAADRAPTDLRLQRKAAELANDELSGLRDAEQRALYEQAKPTLARLEAHAEACSTRVEAGRVRNTAGDAEGAARDFVQSVKDCRSVPAFRAAGGPLRRLERCPELVALAGTVWPVAAQQEWIPILDSVAACSTEVSLRQNLAFAPPEVVSDYFALLDKRARARAAEEARWRAEQQHAEARSRCESECWSARNSCTSGCGSSSYCYNHCQSLESVCRAGCF